MSKLNLKLSHQLMVAFLLVAIIGASIAIVGTIKTNQLAKQIKNMSDGPMNNVLSLISVSDNLHSIDSNSQKYVITWDLTTRATAQEEIENAQKENKRLIGELQKKMDEKESQMLVKKIDELAGPYYSSIGKVIKDASDGTIQGVIVGDVNDQRDELAAAVKKALDYERLAVAKVSENAVDDSSSTSQLMLGLAVVAAFVGVAMGAYMAKNLSSTINTIVEKIKCVASGDLTNKVSVSSGSAEAKLIHQAVLEMQSNLTDVVGNVRGASVGVALASAEIAQGNTDLSDRTENQASALQQTSSAMDQLNTKVAQNAESSQRAHELAIQASATAQSGGKVVDTVISTMVNISDSSQKIAEIIGVINGIAFQTNILALNAAVEAARAGDQGRGFAVVASEVRTLAGRSAEAAKQIKELIDTNVERVEKGTALADSAGRTMQEIVSSISSVTNLMVEISASSRDQALDVQQVARAITQMDVVTQQNAALVEEMAAAANSLKSLADEQVRAVSVFKLEAQDPANESISEAEQLNILRPRYLS